MTDGSNESVATKVMDAYKELPTGGKTAVKAVGIGVVGGIMIPFIPFVYAGIASAGVYAIAKSYFKKTD